VYAEAKRKARDHVRRQGEQKQVVAPRTDRSFLLAWETIGEVWNGPNRIWFTSFRSGLSDTITATFLLAVVAGSIAAVILGGYGIAHLTASAL
jgi:hypothetical protein